MKKILALIVAVGLIITSAGGAALSATDNREDFFSMPPVTFPLPR